ncbi:MAG: hypothetical protein M1817_005755 [Caeruleum heppii]|nr:MAG: hypothetical protein M1817_005755 [Caeruleum heppii]
MTGSTSLSSVSASTYNRQANHHPNSSSTSQSYPFSFPPQHSCARSSQSIDVTQRGESTSRCPPSPTSNRRSSNAPSDHLHRRKSSTNHAIVPSLQIPSTINNSKGSLAEFAAQITCLFWFESSYVLHRVEDITTPPIPSTPLVSDAVPSLGFRKWVTTILSTTQVTQNVILLALLFIYRLKKLNPTVKGKSGSEFRLLTVALMLGNKFLDDNTYTNKTWAEVSGISVQEIHIMEVEFLSNMRYSLYTTEHEWRDWHVKLGRFWDYFDGASKAPVEAAARPSNTTLNLPSSLPSPPASNHASPPFGATISPNPTAYPRPMATFPPPAPSPASMSDFDLRPSERKRSYDDASQEPPSKRMLRSSVPLAAPSQSGTANYLHATGPRQQMPRLPPPSLTMPSQPSGRGFSGAPSTQLPPPAGRAMSSVYNTVWPHSQSSTPTASGADTTHATYGGRHQTPFTPTTSGSSPTSTVFPPHMMSQAQPSPSYFLKNRNSPYRPVRGVSQLLVPPPSSAVQRGPQSVGQDQMHYHPLGKSRNECRTGVVPYMHHDAWQHLQPMSQWPTLSQPSYHT